MNIQEFRKSYPHYNDMNDVDLATSLHKKFYSDMPYDTFAQKFGVSKPVVTAFDPEGLGYDYATAKAGGLKPDETGHWPSRFPKTGQILKGQKHPTYNLTLEGEKEAGYEIYKGKDGRYYSRPSVTRASTMEPSPPPEYQVERPFDPVEPPRMEEPGVKLPFVRPSLAAAKTLGRGAELGVRGGKRVINAAVVKPIRKLYEGSSLAELDTALALIDDKEFGEYLNQPPERDKKGRVVIDFGKINEFARKAKQRTKEQTAKAMPGFKIPAPETRAEKTVDFIGNVVGGVGGFIGRIVLLKKMLGGGGTIRDTLAWELENQFMGGPTGKGAAIRGSLGAIAKIPTGSVTGKVAKVVAQSGLFSTATAISGGNKEDIIVSALIPVVFNSWHFIKQRQYITNYERGLRQGAYKEYQNRIKRGVPEPTSAAHLKADQRLILDAVAKAKQRIYRDNAFATTKEKWELERQKALKMIASGDPKQVRQGNDILDFLARKPAEAPTVPITTQIKQIRQAAKAVRGEKFRLPKDIAREAARPTAPAKPGLEAIAEQLPKPVVTPLEAAVAPPVAVPPIKPIKVPPEAITEGKVVEQIKRQFEREIEAGKVARGQEGEVFKRGQQQFNVTAGYELADFGDLKTFTAEEVPQLRSALIKKDPDVVAKANIRNPILLGTTEEGSFVIDGHHRVEKAIQEGKPIQGLVLTQAQTKKISSKIGEDLAPTPEAKPPAVEAAKPAAVGVAPEAKPYVGLIPGTSEWAETLKKYPELKPEMVEYATRVAREIRFAQERGKRPKPEEIVKRLAKPAAKEPWEMTQEEYRNFSIAKDVRLQAELLEGAEIDITAKHGQLVKEAIDRGEKVPDKVLAQYPSLEPAGVFEEDVRWKMTQEEFIGSATTPEARRTKAIMHRIAVKQALTEGKPVPRAVLEEYKSEKWAQEVLAKGEKVEAKEIKYEEETITEPAPSPQVESWQAKKAVPKGKPTGTLDPTKYEDAIKITKSHANWVAAGERWDPRTVWEGIYSDEKVEYTPEQVDTAYRTIQKPVPSPMPDTELFAMPGKEAEIQAIGQKMTKMKGVSRKVRKGIRLTKPPGLPKAKTSQADHIKAIYQATAKETTRYAINGLKVEGDTIIATDGRRMFWAKGKWGKDGIYLDAVFLKNGLLGKPDKKGLTFPKWRDIVPDVSGQKPVYVKDLEAVWHHIRQAQILTTEESKGIIVIVNKDGSLGFAAASPETGHVEINVNPGGKILGGVNPQYLLDVVGFHATRGNKSFEFYFSNWDRPIHTKSTDGKTFTVTMPINIEGIDTPSEAIVKAISEGRVAVVAKPAEKPKVKLVIKETEAAKFARQARIEEAMTKGEMGEIELEPASTSPAFNKHVDYFETRQLPADSKIPDIQKKIRQINGQRLAGKITPAKANSLIKAWRVKLLAQAQREGISLRATKGGKVSPAVRKAGTYVPEEFSQYGKFKDVYPLGQDTTRSIQQIDGALSIKEKVRMKGQAGVTERYVLWPTREMSKQKLEYIKEKSVQLKKILKAKRGSKEDTEINVVLERISKEDRSRPIKDILNVKTIKAMGVKHSAVNQAIELRKFYDDLIEEQNFIRDMREQDPIPYRHNYSPHILRDTTIWERMMMKGMDKPREIFAAKAPLPDYIKPNKPFNPRELAREAGIPYDKRVKSAIELAQSYLVTAAKDIFNTSIIQNNKAFIQQLEAMGNKNAANFISDWTAEAYAGIAPALDRGIKLTYLPKARRGMQWLNRIRNLAVFPLNFSWNLLTQTSSLALTVGRYGTINTTRGFYQWLKPSIRKQASQDYYSYIIKSARQGKITRQDAQNLIGEEVKLRRTKGELARDISTYFLEQLEKLLTGTSIRAAYLHGAKRGLTGEALKNYASDGGAKTQSMYNDEDKPAFLRSLAVKTGAPYQTFAYEVMNTLREWAGRTGTPPDTKLYTVWTVLRFLAAATIFAAIAKKAANKDVWSWKRPPIPFAEFWLSPIIRVFNKEYMAKSASGLTAPVETATRIAKGIDDVLETNSWRKLRNELVKYGPSIFGIPGGIQWSRTVDAIIAYSQGGVKDRRGRLLFKMEDPQDLVQAIFSGVWTTKGGREYLEKRAGKGKEKGKVSRKILQRKVIKRKVLERKVLER